MTIGKVIDIEFYHGRTAILIAMVYLYKYCYFFFKVVQVKCKEFYLDILTTKPF